MILVDSRIGSAEYLKPLQEFVSARETVLNSGDFCWSGSGPDGDITIGMELKKLGDAITSMRSGRYADQVERMKEDYQICYLMVQGSYAPDEKGTLCVPTRGGWQPLNLSARGQRRRANYTYSELDKFLASVEVVERIVVRKSCNKADTVAQIVDLYNYWQKPWNQHDSTKAIKFQTGIVTKRASLCRMVAAQLPGIGWDIAAHVERHFGTVARMVSADIEEWKEIRWKSASGKSMSLGEKKSQAVWLAMREME